MRAPEEEIPGSFPWKLDEGRLRLITTIAFAIVLLLAAILAFSSALRNPYPVGIGGLYITFAQTIVENDFRLPAEAPYYSTSGVPFIFPPLAFYLMAFLAHFAGIGFLTIERFLPAIIHVLSLVPFYFLARQMIGQVLGCRDENRQALAALLATLILATTPTFFLPHLQGAGVTRGLAFLFMAAALAVGFRMIRYPRPTLALVTGALFGLILITHPAYSLLFVLFFGVIAAFNGRNRRSIGYAMAVLLIGGVVSSAWWLQVVGMHGVSFIPSALTAQRSSLLDIIYTATTFNRIGWEPYLSIWQVLAIVGFFYCLGVKRFLLPSLLVVVLLIYTNNPSIFMATAALLAGVAVAKVMVPNLGPALSSPGQAFIAAVLPVLAVGLYGLGSGLVFLHGVPFGGPPPLMPVILTPDHMQAIEWARAETDPGTSFLIIGEIREWFPALAERTAPAVHVGSEWVPGRYERQREMRTQLEDCGSQTSYCISQFTGRFALRADYLYVSREAVNATLISSLVRDPNFKQEFGNGSATVFAMPPP